jgi:hypothetical protein
VERPENAADALVRRAHAGAYRYPTDFAGFRASVEWQVDGRSGSGTVITRIGPETENGIDIELESDAVDDGRAWVERELRSIVGHRRATAYELADGRHAKRMGEDSGHPLGTVVEMDDEYGSSYRVSDDEISTVTRTLGERRFTIVVHDRLQAPDGTGLPTSFSVFYWDAASGALASAEAYRDVPVEVDGILLPASRTVVRGTSEGLAVRSLELTGHELVAGGRS